MKPRTFLAVVALLSLVVPALADQPQPSRHSYRVVRAGDTATVRGHSRIVRGYSRGVEAQPAVEQKTDGAVQSVATRDLSTTSVTQPVAASSVQNVVAAVAQREATELVPSRIARHSTGTIVRNHASYRPVAHASTRGVTYVRPALHAGRTNNRVIAYGNTYGTYSPASYRAVGCNTYYYPTTYYSQPVLSYPSTSCYYSLPYYSGYQYDYCPTYRYNYCPSYRFGVSYSRFGRGRSHYGGFFNYGSCGSSFGIFLRF